MLGINLDDEAKQGKCLEYLKMLLGITDNNSLMDLLL